MRSSSSFIPLEFSNNHRTHTSYRSYRSYKSHRSDWVAPVPAATCNSFKIRAVTSPQSCQCAGADKTGRKGGQADVSADSMQSRGKSVVGFSHLTTLPTS